MDENSLSSESICSDDTEYLLGQNVSIREIDEFDLKPSTKFEKAEKISSLIYNEDRQSSRIRNENRKEQYLIDSFDQRKEEKGRAPSIKKLQESDLHGYDERGKAKYSAKSYGKERCTQIYPLSQKFISDSKYLGIEKKGSNLGKPSQGKTKVQSSAQHGKPKPCVEKGKRIIGDVKQREEHKDKSRDRILYADKRVDLTRGGPTIVISEAQPEQRKGWKHKNSPVNFDKSWNKEVYEEEEHFDSPEQADVGSFASEATEDLLKQDDELDGSIIEKLKELNLAVSFDADTQELDDDKVKEGAQLLSKLFGGSIDNYYSSSSVHSGSASSQETSRGESQMDEKRNISNASSKGSATSSMNTGSLQQTPEEMKKNLTRKTKVSFATDESTSFDNSPHVIKRQSPMKAHEENYSPTLKQEARYDDKSASYDGFVRETSALRAAMDYDDDDDDEDVADERYKQQSPSRSSDFYRENEPNLVSGYQRVQQKQRPADVHKREDQADEPANSTGKAPNRYKIERYSDSGQRTLHEVEGEPQWDGFYTSTPHKNAQKDVSSGISGKVDSSDIQKKLYVEKRVALEEVQVLDDKLKRTRADIKTSENLAEQYRQQVTKTRSELMDLEVERDSARQDIKEMENILIKQKQESNEAFKVDRKNEMKVLELSLDNNKLQRELEILKTKLEQSESTLENENKLHQEKIGMLQEQFRDGQRSLEKNIQKLRKQLEEERENARSSHYERIQSIQKFQDESKEIQEREIEAVKTRLTRENEGQLEKLQEKANREMDGLLRRIQDGKFRISQLETTLREKEQEVDLLKTKLIEEKQKAYDNEISLKEENSKLESYAKALKAEVDSLRQREANLSASNRTLEQSYDEKIQETRRLQDKIHNQLEESSKLQENKEDEIQMLRGLVRQQEDATRLLGEKLRTEAQEQIRSALQREREAVDKEREKQKEKLDEIKNSYDDIVKQVRAELEEERTSHHQLQTAALKMKKEIEKLRETNLLAQEEKVNAVAQLRSESKEQIVKLKDKIQELALVTDRNEKDIVLEINEECRRVAAVIGGSPNTTPIKSNSLSSSFTGSITGKESPGSSTNSPARDALANLKSCNAELRQHLIEAKREMEYHNNDSFRKQPDSADLTQQISLFKKALKSKDDKIARLKRQVQEDTNKSMAQFKSERAVMQKTIDRLEKDLRETKKLIPASSPIVNGHCSLENASTSGMGTSFSSCTSPRPGEDSSTSRLLRHLQGRVQQLRAQNDSLRSDSLNESQSSVSTVDTTYVDGAESDQIRKLHSALQLSDQRANRNAAMLSQKMLEMTKLQKMLTHATKENMKLERAYASLQQKIIDTSP